MSFEVSGLGVCLREFGVSRGDSDKHLVYEDGSYLTLYQILLVFRK